MNYKARAKTVQCLQNLVKRFKTDTLLNVVNKNNAQIFGEQHENNKPYQADILKDEVFYII